MKRNTRVTLNVTAFALSIDGDDGESMLVYPTNDPHHRAAAAAAGDVDFRRRSQRPLVVIGEVFGGDRLGFRRCRGWSRPARRTLVSGDQLAKWESLDAEKQLSDLRYSGKFNIHQY